MLDHLFGHCLTQESGNPPEPLCRGGKRGGAREHCSQKEMDQTSLGRRIPAKSTAFVAILIKRAIYCTSAVGPMKNRFFFFVINIKEYVLKYRKIPSAEGYKNNELCIAFSCTG